MPAFPMALEQPGDPLGRPEVRPVGILQLDPQSGFVFDLNLGFDGLEGTFEFGQVVGMTGESLGGLF